MTSQPRSDNVLPRRPPEDHDIPGLGAAKIGRISFGDAYRIAGQAEKTKAGDPEEYANRVFSHIILEPNLTMDEASGSSRLRHSEGLVCDAPWTNFPPRLPG